MDDLKWIKKHYGEKMMHLCRSLFPKILEKENLLPIILEKHFPHNRHLAEDILEQHQETHFQDYIFSFVQAESKASNVDEGKSAVELMKEAGYTLYSECKTEEEIQSFKKYWKKNEELCTFLGGRLKDCRVWFAIKDNIEDIKRENFDNPKRQDEYGTSAISIQFTKSRNQSCSIKNRYNHSVYNPDNTFNSNLDNIVIGLTDAFERDYGVRDRINRDRCDFRLYNYIEVDGKYYYYTNELNDVYYCENNVVVDHGVVKQLPLHQMLIDYFIIDFKEKTISYYDSGVLDCFVESVKDISKMTFNDGILEISVQDGEDIEIAIDDKNRIKSYNNPNLETCGNNFMFYCKGLTSLDVSNLKKCGDGFAFCGKDIDTLNVPSLEECGHCFCYSTRNLNALDMPKLELCGRSFFHDAENIKEINMPNLIKSGPDFMFSNEKVEVLNFDNLVECGRSFLARNERIHEVNMPKLVTCGDNFLQFNENLKYLNLPNLEECGKDFLFYNKKLEELNLPKLKRTNGGFLESNKIVNKDQYEM